MLDVGTFAFLSTYREGIQLGSKIYLEQGKNSADLIVLNSLIRVDILSK